MEAEKEAAYQFLVVYHFVFNMLNHNCEQAGMFEFEVFVFNLPLSCTRLKKALTERKHLFIMVKSLTRIRLLVDSSEGQKLISHF